MTGIAGMAGSCGAMVVSTPPDTWGMPSWPTHEDTRRAAQVLKRSLAVHASGNDFVILKRALSAVKEKDDTWFIMPATRRRTIAALQEMANAIALVPHEDIDLASQDDIHASFATAVEAYQAIVRRAASRIPEGSHFLNRRHWIALAILGLTIGLWIAINYWKRAPACIKAILSLSQLITAGVQFFCGRHLDATTIAEPIDKLLHSLADGIKAQVINNGNKAMIKSSQRLHDNSQRQHDSSQRQIDSLKGSFDLLKEGTQSQIDVLRAEMKAEMAREFAALQSAHAEQMAKLVEHLTDPQHATRCTALASASEPANDAPRRVTEYG